MFVVAGGAPLVVLSAALVALGAGLGATGVAVSATSYRDVPPTAIPRATSLLSVVQGIGASFGTVAIALVLQRQLATVDAAGRDAIDTAFAHTFKWALGFLAVAAFVVLFLPTTPPTDTRDAGTRSRT